MSSTSADPPPVSFVDTNILVYAIVDDDPVRSPIAAGLVHELMFSGQLRTSTQVLQETYVVAIRKGKPPMPSERVLRYLDRVAD